MLTEGRISINGKVVKELGTRIDPDQDQVTVDGRLVSERPPLVYWMLNKPDLCLTSRAREDGKATIFDLPALRQVKFLLYPVGRLDYRTEGLLLLSNDGELVHRLTHPSFKVPRTYQVLVQKRLTDEEEAKLRRGLTLDDGPAAGVDLNFIQTIDMGQSRGAWYMITVREGRNRLVRRLFEHLGNKVVRLLRYSYGDLHLPESLKPGEYRQLTSQEIQSLKNAVGLKD
ncbi:pseudouridine synthase [Oligoflexus tunisiensis]|uniref:pseudouridine synthase n=1 Tax=Oligoflexus tunisiensis TaxID=708132 RepID=UPI00350E545F